MVSKRYLDCPQWFITSPNAWEYNVPNQTLKLPFLTGLPETPRRIVTPSQASLHVVRRQLQVGRSFRGAVHLSI